MDTQKLQALLVPMYEAELRENGSVLDPGLGFKLEMVGRQYVVSRKGKIIKTTSVRSEALNAYVAAKQKRYQF